MKIVLIGESGENLGEVQFDVARKMAKDAGKSLVMVNAKANIYKIIDEGKLKYEQKQKEKNQRAQKRTHKIKEIKLRLTTDQHDIDIKVKHIREFLSEGLKTKITLQLKGRQQSFTDVGLAKMRDIVLAACEGNLASLDKDLAVEGKNIIAFLIPTKQQPCVAPITT